MATMAAEARNLRARRAHAHLRADLEWHAEQCGTCNELGAVPVMAGGPYRQRVSYFDLCPVYRDELYASA